MKSGCIIFPSGYLSFFKKRYSYISLSLFAFILICSFQTRAQILWSTATGQAWLTATNWTGGVVPNATDIAQFGTDPTSGVTGIGINMNGATNNGAANQAVGAIEVLAVRPVGIYIGNSSTSVNGTLTLNGATVNAVNNVILRNNSSSLFELTDQQGFNTTQLMTVALNNNTNNIINIDGTGGITISSVISGAAKQLSLGGSGNGILHLTAANTYTGLTTVSSNTLRLNRAGGGTLAAANSVLINGGVLQISSDQTINNFTMSSGTLQIDAGVTLTLTGAYTVTGGNINNSGFIKLNGGAIAFPGTGVTINNGFANTMTSLEIASTGDITQTAPFTIDNQLVLTSGVLVSDNINRITCSPGIMITGGSNASFIDGPVTRIGNTLFTFPVGKRNCGPSATVRGYAPLEISNYTSGAPTDRFTAEYKRGTAYALGAISVAGLDHISSCDYWILTRDAGTAKVDIRLFWDEPINNCTANAPYINSLLSLTIAHNNNAGGTWDAMGMNGMTTGTTTAGSVYWAGIQSNTFGAFVIGSIDFMNPLPVNINYFTGLKQNGGHLLKWKLTCNSTAAVNMVMERSMDGTNYQVIYSEDANALRCEQPFHFVDNNPAVGVNYYRIKITDAEGKISYSSIVSLINAAKGIEVMNIAPNPVVSGSFNLRISAAEKMDMQIVISDMQGRILQSHNADMVAGFNSIPVNVLALAKGSYQVAVNATGIKTRWLRFVVQ